MTQAVNLGFPRIGARRDLKKAVEGYWKGTLDAGQLLQTAANLRADHWRLQADAGLDCVPTGDFSFYDQVLDTTVMLGAVPERFEANEEIVSLDTYFAMARGTKDAPAMEMTKWFDTNYHYIVPEFTRNQEFHLASNKPLDEFREAKAQGHTARPVLLGPVTWLSLGKTKEAGFDPLDHLDAILPIYAQVLKALASAGAEWVQIDEPILALDLSSAQKDALQRAYARLSQAEVNLMLTPYFDRLGDNLDLALSLPVAGLHLDLVRGPSDLDAVVAAAPNKVISLGVINGRNVWRADLSSVLDWIEGPVTKLGRDRVVIAPSCSLLHTPIDLVYETKLDDELKSWLAFAKQKIEEVAVLSTALTKGRDAVSEALAASDAACKARKASPRIHNAAVHERLTNVTAKDEARATPFKDRRKLQQKKLKLPVLPTTTIGSFPQTADVRKARASFRRGDISEADYNQFLRDQTRDAIRFQEEIGVDVLVHGEFERNDMVEYFGEQLDGFAFTRNGWVQSYGSRCVKPPLIYGDVSRPEPMTVAWSQYAQSLTERPVKGMLTGPVTILQWSFVRDDQPRRDTCRQIALAIRDEVVDLEAAGIGVIQIDEPALREGLPLRTSDHAAYLDWAVTAFRLSASGIADETQIHTHMCYSEFNDIMPSIAAMDADVISIETSRSDMELLSVFADFEYPNEIGPGIWDIHSPRVPGQPEMEALLRKAVDAVGPEKLWVNPDCGLKTRGWEEVRASLTHLVNAARTLRADIKVDA
ncbi:5-methyltetrahydropteroyltriglutamate--homocysteine S-methyltransferase [Pseudovibrio exalbescens]|uniref:5-methyltetrahydropteroyltriglutamate--homocysteine methyltransferase n=1 Tax=Pseudovibrio exalbescens TaxID=197461 RepID=A0A1U7JF26_9HYPH|nr:5-methyltetrahydropteroyltriglutamate--homocysteine S-methyltransferase [Pseudovibrio exalbescens]OKL43317.1 5-methyltetrahydropteroyltriglutamate--homocysteine S-methyltransferase [Pseudovibrio exalbescens]